MPSPTISLGESEEWHTMNAEVTWTDGGTMIVRRPLSGGGMVNYVFDIGSDKARQMVRDNDFVIKTRA